jgi:peptidoglycan/xylan/chitin deacetylase (PgdA/CDA1 family)
MKSLIPVSLSYDGGDMSHLETVVPDLNDRGLKATFYLEPTHLLEQIVEWRSVAAVGHEIGNGCLLGACLPDGSLPAWTLEMILEELVASRELLADLLPGRISTAALPWGKAECSESDDYAVDVIEAMGPVRTGAVGFNDVQSPGHRLRMIPMVGLSGKQMVDVVRQAQDKEQWPILSFGGVGSGERSVDVSAHRELLDYLVSHKPEFSTKPVIHLVESSILKSSFRVV